MMRFTLLVIIVIGFNCSSSNKESVKEAPSPATTSKEPDPATPPPPPPASIRPNMTLMGAVINSIQLTDDFNYTLDLTVQTALPHRGVESLLEPGANVVVRPAFERDTQGTISLESARNKRLMEPRELKAGDALMGKISLFQDGTWYLVDTTLD